MPAPQDVSHHAALLRAHSLLTAKQCLPAFILHIAPCLQRRPGLLLWFDVLPTVSVLVPGCLQRERAVSDHGAL